MPEYPYEAIRAALINVIAHMGYNRSANNGVENA